jgi:signal transduction histidine kinase
MARRATKPPTGHTILVVDDQEETLKSVRSLLQREGHEVLTAGSVDRALDLFKEHDVHLLLVDYFMPGKTGEALVREIRTFDPYVQVILQTGYSGDRPPRSMLKDLDIQGYHDKAEGPEKLLIWVDVGLKAHRTIQCLRERERLQGELLANISHEFRTPLNVITGYTELLLDGEFGTLPLGAIEPLEGIAAATNNLTDLVQDFLKYARIHASVMHVKEEAVSTKDLACELYRLGNVLVEPKGVSFSVEVTDTPAEFVADPVKLRTILRNLVTNAAKFTSRGGIRVCVNRRAEALHFAVRDTGPGIAAGYLELIFEPFRQVDSSSTRVHGGVGLGLALSRKLARLLAGDLEVQSEPGVGSTFTLRLPAKGISAETVSLAMGEQDTPPRAAVVQMAVGFA